jgi:hypothetical protein
MLVAVLSLAVLSPAAQAETKKKAYADKKAAVGLVSKSYPVADLIDAADGHDADLLIKFVMQAVKPSSWQEHGGPASIDYFPVGKALVIKQTPAAQAQISALLKALVKLQSDAGKHEPHGAMIGAAVGAVCGGVVPANFAPPAPLPCPARATAKQYGHFVLDNVRVNAMGVTVNIKKVKLMYKGDGIEADVAKCALTNGDSERKGNKEEEQVLQQVKDLLDWLKKKTEDADEKRSPACYAPAPACPRACESHEVPPAPTCTKALPIDGVANCQPAAVLGAPMGSSCSPATKCEEIGMPRESKRDE